MKRQYDPNVRCTLVHVGPTMRGALTLTLPLINTILDHLQGKNLFTKFDIWWGYNNICIKEEDQ